jgi:hypothetical protein
LLADLMTVRIDTGAHGGDEVFELPFLDEIKVGAERRKLTWDAASQILPMALAAILIGQDVFAMRRTRGRQSSKCPE